MQDNCFSLVRGVVLVVSFRVCRICFSFWSFRLFWWFRFARFGGFVSLVLVVSFWWFRFGCFVSLFRVLVHACVQTAVQVYLFWCIMQINFDLLGVGQYRYM